jgi:hypothetical protein
MLSQMFFFNVYHIQIMLNKQCFPVWQLKKILFFLQLCHLVSSSRCFLFFDVLPNFTCSKLSYCCSTCSPVSGIGDSLISTMLLKLILFLYHLWFIERMWRCPCSIVWTHISATYTQYPCDSMDMQICLTCSNQIALHM